MKQQANEQQQFTESDGEIRAMIQEVTAIYLSASERLKKLYPGSELHFRVQGIETWAQHPENMLMIVNENDYRFIVGNYWTKCGIVQSEETIQGLFPKIEIVFKK